jgi:hypothetical protein
LRAEVQIMEQGRLALIGSAIAILVLIAPSVARAADLGTSVPTGSGAQVGGAVDSAVDAAKGTSSQSVEKAAKDAANQEVEGAKEKAKSATGQAIDSIGTGTEAR